MSAYGYDAAHARWSELYRALMGAIDLLARVDDTRDESRQKALAHLAPFFAQSVHSSTLVGSGHVAENHATDEEAPSRKELIDALRSTTARLAEADRFMVIEFGQLYTRAPHEQRLALIRDLLRGENGS